MPRKRRAINAAIPRATLSGSARPAAAQAETYTGRLGGRIIRRPHDDALLARY